MIMKTKKNKSKYPWIESDFKNMNLSKKDKDDLGDLILELMGLLARLIFINDKQEKPKKKTRG